MRNIWILLKNYLLCGIGNLRSKKSRTKTIVGIATVTAFYAGFFALMLFFMLTLAQSSTSRDSVLAMGLIISVFISVVFALQKITGGQKNNDTELLLSMPFKKIEIVIAKTLASFMFNFFIVILFFLPSIIAYLVYTPFNMLTVLGCIVMFFLIPLMAVGLSSIIDFLITVCFSNTKFGNISKALFTLITLIAVMVVYEFLALNMENPVIMHNTINWIVTFNVLIMLPIIGGVLLVFVFGCWLNSLLLNRESRTATFKNRAISTKTTTPFKSLLKIESNRYFNSPTLMINTLIGPLGILALTIWIIVDKCRTFLTFASIFGASNDLAYLFIGLLFSGCAVLTYPTAVSISLEGKQLWILRSMPISANTVLSAKALFNVLLLTPFILGCGILLLSVLNIPITSFIIMMIIPILTTILVSYAGVMINLWFPKLEFENENLLIKQSMSSVIMLFAGLVVMLALGGLTFWLLFELPVTLIVIILSSLLTVVTGVFVTLTYTIGKRIFNHL